VIAADFATLVPAMRSPAQARPGSAHQPANALLQAQRVADARKLPIEQVKELIKQNTDQPSLGFSAIRA